MVFAVCNAKLMLFSVYSSNYGIKSHLAHPFFCFSQMFCPRFTSKTLKRYIVDTHIAHIGMNTYGQLISLRLSTSPPIVSDVLSYISPLYFPQESIKSRKKITVRTFSATYIPHQTIFFHNFAQ